MVTTRADIKLQPNSQFIDHSIVPDLSTLLYTDCYSWDCYNKLANFGTNTHKTVCLLLFRVLLLYASSHTVPLKCNVALACQFFPRISILDALPLNKYWHKFYESQDWCRGLDWLNSITRGSFHFVARVINPSSLQQLDHSLKLVS